MAEVVGSLIFDQVVVRVSDQFQLELHLDIDEANAAGVRNGEKVELLDCKSLLFRQCTNHPALRFMEGISC